MIYLGPIKGKEKIKRFFESNNIDFTENSGVVAARDGDTVCGYALYSMDESSITVLDLKPSDDLSFADGILRSTLHVAAERSVMNAFYGDRIEALAKKLKFIKDESEKRLDIDKLFKSCCECASKNP